MGVYKNGKKLGQPYFNGKKMNCYHNGKKLWSGEYNEFIPESEGTFDLIYEGLDSDGSLTSVEADIVAYRVNGWTNPRTISELIVPSEHNGKPVTQILKIINGTAQNIVIDKLLIGSNITRIYTSLFNLNNLIELNYVYIPSTVADINYNGNSSEAGLFGSTVGPKILYYNAINAYCAYSTSKNSGYTPWDFKEALNSEVIIGRDVEVIQGYAFAKEPIAKLTFDRNTKCHTLGTTCFDETNIVEVDIPKSVINIKAGALGGRSLVKATVRGNAIIEDGAFRPYNNVGVANGSLLEVNLLGSSIIATSNIFAVPNQPSVRQEHLYFIRNLSSNSVGYDLEFQEELFDIVTPFTNTFEIIDNKYWVLNTIADGHTNLINILPGDNVDLSDATFTRILVGASVLNRNTGSLTLPNTVQIIKSLAIFGNKLSSIIIGDAVNGSNLQSVEVNGLAGNTNYQLHLYGTTPPVVVQSSFKSTLSADVGAIRVPSGSVSTYQNNADWISSGYASKVVSM